MKRFIYIIMLLAMVACGQAEGAQKGQVFQTLLSGLRFDGATLSAGKVYFYVPGGTTPKAIYTTRNKTVEAANPYTLDANGQAQVFGDGTYDIKVTTSAGVQKAYWYGVALSDVSSLNTVSAGDYASLNAAVSAIGSTFTRLLINSTIVLDSNLVLPSNIELDVTAAGRIDVAGYTLTGLKESKPEYFDFNTVPGTTDMADAITKASAASKTVVFSRTTYGISKSIPIPTQAVWRGEGTGTVIKALSTWNPAIPTITASTYSPVLSYAPMIYNPTAIDYWSIEGIELDGNGKDCYGLYLVENYHGSIKDVLVYNTNKRPYTNIRGQSVTHTNMTNYGSGDGVLTYDNTGFIFIGSGFERLGGTWSYDQRQPSSFSKGGVTLLDCWFESAVGAAPTSGFLRTSGRRNSVKAHFGFHTTATTERMLELNDTTDSVVVDGITMGASPAVNGEYWVNNSSGSMLITAKLGSTGNKIKGNFINTKVTDSGVGNTWDINASLATPVNHVTGRFQVRYPDIGAGIPIAATSYVMDVDYAAGTQKISLFGNANNSLTNPSGKLQINSNLATVINAGGNIDMTATGAYSFTGASGASGYTHPLYLGSYAIWVASTGKLYIKAGIPASDTDGTIVGQQ